MSYRRTRDELMEQLHRQMRFMHVSSKAYDDGQEDEAARLAASLRILFHDTKNQTSLLTELGIRDGLQLVDTVPPIIPDAIMQTRGLVHMAINAESGQYVAPLDNPIGPSRMGRARTPFQTWWESPVQTDRLGAEFSRRSIVLFAAHKEGGAHVDAELTSEWAALIRENSLGWEFHSGDADPEPFGGNVAFASVRQIVWELEATDITSQLDAPMRAGRNDPCPCGSGLKFKRCHGSA
jgi:hypothetical protein